MTLARPVDRKADDNAAVPLVPLVERLIISGNDLLEHVRRDRNFKFVGVRRLDEYVFAAKFDFGQFPPKIAWAHLSTLPRSKPERFESGTQFLNVGNPRVSLPHINRVDSLRAESDPRRTEEQFRRITAEMTVPRPHDNDNQDWREAA